MAEEVSFSAAERTKPRPRFGEILLAEGLITEAQLQEALAIQARTGARFGAVLVSLGHINKLAVAQVLARQLGLPFRNLLLNPPEAEAVRLIPEALARAAGAVPTAVEADGSVTVGFVDPLDEAAQRKVAEALRRPIRREVISEYDLQWILDRVYREEYIQRSVMELYYRRPDESAYVTFTTPQLVILLALGLAVLVGAILRPTWTLVIVNILITAIYFIITSYRAYLMYKGLRLKPQEALYPTEPVEIPDRDLPTYTILVPLFREREVLPTLLQAIANLDYPPTKLDVKLLFEESDPETLAAAKALRPPGYFQFVVVPNVPPQTKPKACNYGLISAVGQYCVIYDAEDIPERDQLRKAVAAFRQVDPDVVCLQARLNFYNRDQNILTRWFTSEYSMWFDVFLPGLNATRAPIPLGGTSNHFITERLRELGAWDPFNVTEDADLGVRLHRAGYRTAMLGSTTYEQAASTTYEEANSQLRNWVRQRSRWVKGYMQTWLVHMRYPWRLLKDVGVKNFLSFHVTVGGTPFTLLVNPWYWLVFLLWILTRWDVIYVAFPGVLYYLSLISLVVGNAYFVYFNAVAAYARGYHNLVLYAFLSPFYWVLMSIGAWKGLYQLLVKPYYWEKTIHGLAKTDDLPPTARVRR